jgi:hypothetical protein
VRHAAKKLFRNLADNFLRMNKPVPAKFQALVTVAEVPLDCSNKTLLQPRIDGSA